ncbi:MAG: hypothetical protein EOO77_43735 [Oxalobacteraceae bacterium]|nr:MAG: hypothetical protein EOO77_43735 [Oxalobacteraceae bacterium]
MLSSISSSNLLTQAPPKLLQNSAGLSLQEPKSTAASAVPVARAAKANVDTTSAKANDDGKSATQTQQKTIVDQRTTDTGSMRITVISYSDGSSDTLQQVKNIDQSTPVASAKPFSSSDKGLMLNRTA